MTGSSLLPFPGSRTLAGWWRQLAPLQPEALRVGYLLLHHVEALARWNRPLRPDPFANLVLRALALEALPACPHPACAAPDQATEEQLQRLDGRLHLGRQLLFQVLRGLARQGLIQASAHGWALAEPGRQALTQGEATQSDHGRHTFFFVEPEPAAGTPARAPAFLALRPGTGMPWPAGEDWHFDAAVLRACLAQSPEWKQTRNFPAEVAEILASGETTPDAAGWQRVLVDRPEHLPLVAVRVAAKEGRQVLGFVFQAGGWTLQTAHPVFVLPEGTAEDLSELWHDPGSEVWRQAWRSWAQQRGLPAAEAAACPLELAGVRLRVRVGAPLLEQLHKGPADVFKGEAWLLAGDGRLRAAACLAVTAVEPP